MGFEHTTFRVLDRMLWATEDSLASSHFCELVLRTASRSHTVHHKQHTKA